MQNDPFELHNLYEDASYRGVVEDLRRQLVSLKEKYQDTDEPFTELVQRYIDTVD